MKDLPDVLQTLLRDKVQVRPGTIAALPTQQADRLRSPLDLGRLLLSPLGKVPEPLLRFWLNHPRGVVVIDSHRHEYVPGVQSVGRNNQHGVAWTSARAVLTGTDMLLPAANLLDHLLGSDGVVDRPWLSDGAGRSEAWHLVGDRLKRQFELGYGPESTSSDSHAYFAWGIDTYLSDRQILNVADPGLERLLRTTLFDSRFVQKNL
ncbi:MAG: hypothetical protein U9R25_10015 [Chloroflexota bacterium]|nr:hypothetical protein [Chloroflexota bacterium]